MTCPECNAVMTVIDPAYADGYELMGCSCGYEAAVKKRDLDMSWRERRDLA